jgi:hypothetical protein
MSRTVLIGMLVVAASLFFVLSLLTGPAGYGSVESLRALFSGRR